MAATQEASLRATGPDFQLSWAPLDGDKPARPEWDPCAGHSGNLCWESNPWSAAAGAARPRPPRAHTGAQAQAEHLKIPGCRAWAPSFSHISIKAVVRTWSLCQGRDRDNKPFWGHPNIHTGMAGTAMFFSFMYQAVAGNVYRTKVFLASGQTNIWKMLIWLNSLSTRTPLSGFTTSAW